ncbi:SGNH/GDSL hydrolase family protein [Engelhardtia mirabilis]|uniref:SGNH hydrolase-type esterase domain-containing protein n=1 Tax=Engelhardtia mirabilis TaxID=2528011 RepID=A0A518BGC3_9BACT|nr:hypothetical protein Pla133_10760 [Planctomycetes bacterium Pla133]QDV00337.1 hypothetical protein Pla86_10760 [Planctomycetes bacterium Pla86]
MLALELGVRLLDPLGTSYYRSTNQYLQQSVVLPPDAGRPDGRLFENAPGRSLDCGTSTFATDGAGLRAADADQPAPRPRAQATDVGLRILFLGDSVTLGWGVDFEQTWVATIAREARAPDGRAVQTLNAGHLQYNTVQQVDWFFAHAQALEPDLVVITAVMNDLDDAYALYLAYMDQLASAEQDSPTLLERCTTAFHTHFHGLAGLLQYRREMRAPSAPAPSAGVPIEEREDYRAGWPKAEAALDRLRGACVAAGVPLVVFDHTTPRLPGYREWCERTGVPWYDLAFTPEEWARPIRNSAADAHANAAGNRLLADKALAALRDLGAIAR